tara:strand:+ start:301 stop:936 length:636 start_codon:yes stop_codon:yes gene_type:complete
MQKHKKSKLDLIINELEYALDTILNEANLPSVMTKNNTKNLSSDEIKESSRVMRINHMGEVCAQGLYRGQATCTKNKYIKDELYKICEEENEHLKLCNLRLMELNEKQSVFNPIWYLASFTLGAIAGLKEDKYKMGFIEETEKQVKDHLAESISVLPKKDKRSKDFLEVIAQDEEKHRATAKNIGSEELPNTIKYTMDKLSKVMKKISGYV